MWFTSYLHERTQSITINGTASSPSTLVHGVPQGSVLGPLLYTDYTTPVGDIIRNHGLKMHVYAADTQIYLSSSHTASDIRNTISTIEKCVKDIKIWMTKNKLQLNAEKTEIMILGSKCTLSKVSDIEIELDHQLVKPSSSVRNLGVTFDSTMLMKNHVATVCKSAYYQIRRIWKIRHCLTKEATKTLVHALVVSRLDYANAVLYGLPKSLLNQL